MDQKKNFATVPKAALTSNQQLRFCCLSQLPLLSSPVSTVTLVSPVSIVFLDAPKYQSCIVHKGGRGVEEWHWTADKVLFPFRGVAMSSKHLMYLANYLDLLFLLVHVLLALRRQTNGIEHFVKVVCKSPPEHKTSCADKAIYQNLWWGQPIFYLILLPVKTDLTDQKMCFKPCF